MQVLLPGTSEEGRLLTRPVRYFIALCASWAVRLHWRGYKLYIYVEYTTQVSPIGIRSLPRHRSESGNIIHILLIHLQQYHEQS